MPQIPKYRKVKRAQKSVLVKRRHFLRSYPEIKSYKPLCKKLQSNNNSLAKALSTEKQESQLLFSQNVALIAEVQDLGLACNKRDAVILNILKNAKEMLKMLVTMTGFLTNTISSCQEFAEFGKNLRMSGNSGKDSYRRLSTKSPTRGVVKPMVSGHTITKPTINLSRVNMQHINNSSNLSIIPEVITPPRNRELNTSRSPNMVTMRQHRYENGRTCRMPERLTAASPRNSDENERRLSGRSRRHSGKTSGRLSKLKSRVVKSNVPRNSIENYEHIGSPTVKLNDVSKLLQNSQSINIRMLTENQNNQETDNLENSDDVNQENPEANVISEISSSDSTPDKSIEDKNKQVNNKLDSTNGQEDANVNQTKNRTSNWEDPLEGPSWLFNNSQIVPSFTNKNKKADDVSVSDDDTMSMTLKMSESSDEKSMPQTLSLPISRKRANHANNSKNGKQTNDKNGCNMLQQNENNDNSCNTSTDVNETQCEVDDESRVNLASFITQRRGCLESEDDDDFTLMVARRPCNTHFDINDLKLPVLEQSTLKPVTPAEPEPEITTTLRKISQICVMPSVSNNSLEESAFNRSTVNLPLLVNDYEDKDLSLRNKTKFEQRKKKKRKAAIRESIDFIEGTPPHSKKNNQKKKKDKVVKDPSAVKVVLEKLNECDVKSRTPSPNDIISLGSNQSLSPVSLRVDNTSDSESNTSTNSLHTLNRPRRKRAVINLREPSLIKKLRRNR
ncbi:hypothetical protein WH47_10480 [Habropoda laboriosa]|uniref:Shugoshin C-terminal domain-containing protein n=1 Tax=Habropoda laboriosa TaxID=597456 RepID=A0A0L7QMS8_9HYME|nr:PREDICTED: GATA zinc finger domain-containing protein 14-like [Habropoda laboriosa]KOC59920.1 hypothetical protein WH47_10480 [Habropoda laboriosa]